MKAGYYVDYEVKVKATSVHIMSGSLYSATLEGLKDRMGKFRELVHKMHGGKSKVCFGKAVHAVPVKV